MYKKLIRAMESLNVLFQALYTLALPVGLAAIVSYLLTKYTSVEGWIWAVLLTLGTLSGLYSMVKYLLSALENLDRLEKEREKSLIEKREKEERQESLRAMAKKNKEEGDNNGQENLTSKTE